MPLKFDGKTGEFGACVSHFKSKGKSDLSARKICGAIQKRMEKETSTKFCVFAKLQLKETKENYHVSGYVATSHPDRAASEDGQYVGDIIPKSTLQKIVTDINNKYKPEAGAVSERHDHLKIDPNMPIAGVLAKGTQATLEQLEDGEWGVHVDTVLSKTNPRYEEVKTNIEQGVYPGFSIEFENSESVPTEKEGNMYRLLTGLDTIGFGYAHRRAIANPHAEITDLGYKEITTFKELHNPKEDEEKAKKKKKKGENKMEENKDKKEIKEDAPAGTGTEEKAPEEKKEEKTEEKEIKESKETKEVSEKEWKLLQKFKEEEIKEAEIKKLQPVIDAGIKKELKERGFKDAPLFNKEGDDKPKFKELDDYKTALAEVKELDKPVKHVQHRHSLYTRMIDNQYKEAGKFADGLITNGVDVWGNWLKRSPIPAPSDMKEGVNYSDAPMNTYGSRIESKELGRVEVKAGGGLGVTNSTNANLNLADSSWTYGSYFLSPVELNDIFQPMLVNQLNDQTTTFGRLTKEDWSGRSQIQFRARIGRNSTVGGYKEGVNLTYGTDFSGNVGRAKYQQPFCYYRVLVAVTGQAQRLGQAPGGMGDVWANEIKWSGVDLLSKGGTKGTAATGLNVAILGTGDGTAEDIALGFEGLILGTSGTLYGKTLGTASTSTLHSHKENMSSATIKLKQLRKMIRFVSTGTGSGATEIHSNSRVGDLVFFMHHQQRDNVKALIQDMQKTVPTSARVGFEGEVEFDGVPLVADRQIETDDVFLINVANTKIGMNLPPTLEPLPVTADAQAAHIKTYFNLYSDAPGNNYFAHTFSTA